MKKSKIKNQKSKIQIKNKIFLMLNLTLLLAFPLSAFAHESDTVHEEVPASVDPMLAIGVVVFIAIGGVIIWKLMQGKKNIPPATTPQTQSEPPKTAQQPIQPEHIEAKK